MNPWVRICVSLYRRLARAFPHEFQMIYGDDLERLGEDAAPEIWRRHGFLGLLRLLADIAARLPAEYFSELRQDALYALRRLNKQRGFAAVGIVSLALAIGICTVYFVQIKGMMFRSLPGASDPEALAGTQRAVPYPLFELYREQRNVAASATAFIGPVPFGIAADDTGKPERVFGHLVSPEYFATLGVTPRAGRFFSPEIEKLGSQPVVVVSERFWRAHLNADPGAVGRGLRVNGHNAEIIGIGPEGFLGVYPINPADIFVPLTVDPALAPELSQGILQSTDTARFRVVLRLADGMTLPAAEAALDVMTRNFEAEKSDPDRDQKGRQVALISAGGMMPLSSEQRGMMFGANGFLLGMVLLLACANLATLLLARTHERQKETAIRLSTGASRFRLVRGLVTESVILSVAGSLLGLVFAAWLLDISKSLALPNQSAQMVQLDYRLDLLTLLFTLATAILVGFGFGLAPALAAVRVDLVPALKEGAVTSLRAYRRFGLRNQFVVFQVASALMMLLVSGFVVVGYQKSTGFDAGFDATNLHLFSLDPARDGYSAERSADLLERLPQRLLDLPQVQAISLVDRPPFGDLMIPANNRVSAGKENDGGEEVLHNVAKQRVGASYFAALGVPIVRGREFTDQDQRLESSLNQSPRAEIPVVVNETAARDLFGEDNPLGRGIREEKESYFVIGVARDVKFAFMAAKPPATIFLPVTAESFNRGSALGTTVVLRGSGPDLMNMVRREMALSDPRLTIFNARTMSEQVRQFDSFVRWSTVMNGGLGVFSLILAAIGLAGVTAHTVLRRRKEIGIRMALGARSSQVLRLVLKEGAALVVVGSALGFAGAYALTRVFSSLTAQLAQILDIGTSDPLLLAGAPVLLAGLTFLACYFPARRSTRINPVTALRE
jgi:macrolide transport system ATP-binding/permease protein